MEGGASPENKESEAREINHTMPGEAKRNKKR
jgi:hypothetical protein